MYKIGFMTPFKSDLRQTECTITKPLV